MIKVVAALIRKNNKILLTQRLKGELANLWEFPGGKIEDNETPFEAIVREINEELRIDVTPVVKIHTFYHRYPFAEIELILIKCRVRSRNSKVMLDSHHAQIAWVDISDPLPILAPLDQKVFSYLIKKKTKKRDALKLFPL